MLRYPSGEVSLVTVKDLTLLTPGKPELKDSKRKPKGNNGVAGFFGGFPFRIEYNWGSLCPKKCRSICSYQYTNSRYTLLLYMYYIMCDRDHDIDKVSSLLFRHTLISINKSAWRAQLKEHERTVFNGCFKYRCIPYGLIIRDGLKGDMFSHQ